MMIATYDEADLYDESTVAQATPGSRKFPRDRQWSTECRFRRRGSGARSRNGAHRRRNKRNGL